MPSCARVKLCVTDAAKAIHRIYANKKYCFVLFVNYYARHSIKIYRENAMKVKITALKQTTYSDLIAAYELPQECPCSVNVGQTWTLTACQRPDGMCESAWQTLVPFVRELFAGGGRFYGDWMRDPRSAMVSCNDGFRPVSFLIEAI